MPRTIQCTKCGVVLNVPEQAAGRRLKCPKCGTKFHAHDPGAAASSSMIGLHDADPASSQDFGQRGHGDDMLPTAAGDLRETFDLPLMTEGAPAPAKGSRQAGDALALFQDDKPAAPRRPSAAEARSKARRCPTCGGVVPVGMSVCSTCGLDLETGMRVGLDEDLIPAAAPRAAGPPVGVAIVGGLCLLASVVLALYTALQSVGGAPGWKYFIPVCLFAAFAAVHYLRGKSVKLLLFALSLGAAIDVVGFIAMPIVYANMETRVVKQAPNSSDPDAEEVAFEPIEKRLDTQKLTVGITLLGLYAVLSVFLLSPSMNRHIKK
jgi:hypothetical protein